MQILNEIKEEMLYVAEEPVEGLGIAQQVRAQTVELPDGTQLQIAAPRAQLLEPLFNQVETLEGFTGVQNMVVEVKSGNGSIRAYQVTGTHRNLRCKRDGQHDFT